MPKFIVEGSTLVASVEIDEFGSAHFKVNGYTIAWLDDEDGCLHLNNRIDIEGLAVDSEGQIKVAK